MVSARKIIAVTYQPKIREFLLEGKQIQDAQEFNSLDNEMLETLISQESKNIALGEKKKISKFLLKAHSSDEILERIDTRFLSVS